MGSRSNHLFMGYSPVDPFQNGRYFLTAERNFWAPIHASIYTNMVGRDIFWCVFPNRWCKRGFFFKHSIAILKKCSHRLFSKSSTEDFGIFTCFENPSSKNTSKSSTEDFENMGDPIKWSNLAFENLPQKILQKRCPHYPVLGGSVQLTCRERVFLDSCVHKRELSCLGLIQKYLLLGLFRPYT
jgi:hypothetical protein